MPKKHQNKALLIKPTVASSSSGINPVSPKHRPDGSRSVNDLLREARRNGKQKAAVLDTSNFTSLPPSLRALLNMPEPPPMAARTQIRGPARTRRIPGPPPPRSWLKDSQYAPDGGSGGYLSLRWRGARIQQENSNMPGGHFPDGRSLEHYVLKSIATKWVWHAEYDNSYLATLPVRTRCMLLSYIAVYNDGHWPNPMPFLFPQDGDSDDLEEVTRLDLANSIGGWATVKKIEQEVVVKGLPSGKGKTEIKAILDSEDIPDSWEDEAVTVSGSTPSATARLPKTLTIDHLRFGGLRHLSLAIDPTSTSAIASASWSQLISLSAHLSPLLSLSLAYWPAPTYMPNASQGRTKIKNSIPNAPGIVYSATDPYTPFENNWREAAGILRSLSRNLYCLTWLDLAGCAPWLNALTWNDLAYEIPGVDWNGAWRNVNHVIFSVGWLPGRPSRFDSDTTSSMTRSTTSIDSTRAIEQLYGESETIRNSLSELARLRLGPAPVMTVNEENRTTVPAQPQTWNVEEEREKAYFRKDAERYQSLQKNAREVAKDIRGRRKWVGGGWIEFEFGEVLTDEQLGIW